MKGSIGKRNYFQFFALVLSHEGYAVLDFTSGKNFLKRFRPDARPDYSEYGAQK
jgi:hypothetical protein